MKNIKIKKASAKSLVTLGIVMIFYAAVQAMSSMGLVSRHFKSLLVPICFNAIRAVSLNLVIGFLGELSLGHAGFMSVGAYTSCILSITLAEKLPSLPRAVRFPLALLAGGCAAAAFGLLVGMPVLRLKGDYLAIVTLAFGEILRNIIINLEFLGGASGLKKMPLDSNFTYGVIALVITLAVIQNLVNSRHGRAIQALRDNSIAAQAVGINTNYYKVLVFCVSAFFAGIAGGLYGHNYSILQSSAFSFNKSIEVLVIVVFGGLGNIRGSVIAAALLTILPEELRGLEDYRMLIYSVVLILLMLANANPKFAAFKANLFKRKKEE